MVARISAYGAYVKYPLVRLLPYLLSGFKCGAPRTVDLELTNRCNLRCKMCWFHGENGIGDRYNGMELSTDEVGHLIDQLSRYKPNIYLGGSEPFARQDLLIILEYIKSHGLTVSFTTNGTLLDSGKIEMLVTLGIDQVIFSVDGQEELHDRIRGKGVFKKVTSVIRELSEYKKRRGSIKPSISVNLTINANLAHHIREAIDAVRDATNGEVARYRIHHLWYVTHNELSLHQSAIKQRLGCMAAGAESHFIPSSEVLDPASLADEISSLTNQSKVTSFPDLGHKDILKYYSEGSCIKERCIAPFFVAVVKPNGDVKFCPDEWIDDFVLGNVRNDSFGDIWNNDKARKFRAVLFKQKHFAGCKRCSWMYAF